MRFFERGARLNKNSLLLCFTSLLILPVFLFIDNITESGRHRLVDLEISPENMGEEVHAKKLVVEAQAANPEDTPETLDLNIIKDLLLNFSSVEEDYEWILRLIRSNASIGTIHSLLNKKRLMKVCQNLPEMNEFGDLSAERIDSNGVLYFHFLLMYRTLKPIYFCAIEGLSQAIEMSTSNTQKVEVILWFSEAEALNSSLLSNFLPTLYSPDENDRLTVAAKYLNLTEIFQGTPFEGFYNCFSFLELPLGKFGAQNKGNAARLALLYKYGGFYLDLDFIVGKDVSIFEDGLAMQKADSFNSAALKFTSERSRLFVMSLMKQWVVDFQDLWGKNGPALLNRAIIARKQCTFPERKRYPNGYTGYCHYGVESESANLSVWPAEQVYPVGFDSWEIFLKNDLITRNESSKMASILDDPALIHLWHRYIKAPESTLCKKNWTEYANSVVGNLRKLNCPVVFSTLSREKGCEF